MTSAVANVRNSIGNLAQLVQKPKPVIKIELTGEQRDAFTPSFTTLDQIKGQVSITTQADLNFEDVYISLEGSTRTYVEKIATTSPTNGKTEAYQNFLRLMQPMDPTEFPEPRILKVNTVYNFSFTFVVPEGLLPQACTHPKNDNFPEGAHLSLPPSLGDPAVSGSGKSFLDDMTPDMCTIMYSIRCRISKGRGPSGRHQILTETSKKLRILPAVEEDPPLHAEGGLEDDYKLRKDKSIKRGFLRRKLGRIVAETAQPKSLRLPSIRSDDTAMPTTMATINVRFDPADEKSQPPQLNSIAAKLKVATFYASVPLREVPTKSSDFHYSSVRGIFVDTVPLSSRNLANTNWEHHTTDTNSPIRRDSAWSVGSQAARKIPTASTGYKGRFFYTARVVVPVHLPECNKVFAPSFHSCLISRIYALDLYLSINTPQSSVTDPTIHLKLPIQISVAANPTPSQPGQATQQALTAATDAADEFFQPRNIVPPTPGYQERTTFPPSPPTSTNQHPSFESPVSPRTSVHNPPRASEHPNRVSFALDVPIPENTTPDVRPREQQVRMQQVTQQRFQSLSFETEDHVVEAPPEYTTVGSGRGRIASTATVDTRASVSTGRGI